MEGIKSHLACDKDYRCCSVVQSKVEESFVESIVLKVGLESGIQVVLRCGECMR